MGRDPFEGESEAGAERWGSLADLMSVVPADQPLPLGIAVQIVVQLCQALEALDELGGAGGARSSLSPEHVVLDTDGLVTFLDAGAEPGEPGNEVLFLGTLLYQLTTGLDPASNLAPSEVNGAYPLALERVVRRALEPERAERFHSCGELRGALVAAFPGYASEPELAELLHHLRERDASVSE